MIPSNIAKTILLAGIFLSGCVSIDPQSDYVRVNPKIAGLKRSDFDIRIITESESAFYIIKSLDGREWKIPTAFYHPDKAGVDNKMMKDYYVVYQIFSPDREIIGFQESGLGTDQSRRLLFINGKDARLFELIRGNRSKKNLRYEGEPIFWYTWAIDEISNGGVSINKIFFPWKNIEFHPIGTYTSDPQQ